MSLSTWKKEFYPAISKCPKSKSAAHSLKKWIGLLPSNLKKHGLYQDPYSKVNLYETLDPTDYSTGFRVDGVTCALCFHYYGYNETNKEKTYSEEGHYPCYNCPLAIILGTNKTEEIGCALEYDAFAQPDDRSDPKPMIKALRKAVKYQEKESKHGKSKLKPKSKPKSKS